MKRRRSLLMPMLVGALALLGAACAPEEEAGGFTPGRLGAVLMPPPT